MLRRTLDQHIRIEVEVPPACPALLADPGQLESALLNIAINARDAMADGGTLRFGAQACPALPGKVRNDLDDPSAPIDGFVAITISDTGSGMPDEVKDRAFEPFFTTKEPGRGTGLGLSTVYGFIKQSKGAISIESAPGVGTTLTLYVPRPWNVSLPVVEEAFVDQQVPDGLSVTGRRRCRGAPGGVLIPGENELQSHRRHQCGTSFVLTGSGRSVRPVAHGHCLGCGHARH